MQMKVSEKLIAVVLAMLMLVGSFSVLGYAVNDPDAASGTLTIEPKIYKSVEGNWVEAGTGGSSNRLSPGEDVLLRVFLNTSFYTNNGYIKLVFDPDFFSYDVSDFTPVSTVGDDTYYALTVNPSNADATAGFTATALFDAAGSISVALEFGLSARSNAYRYQSRRI